MIKDEKVARAAPFRVLQDWSVLLGHSLQMVVTRLLFSCMVPICWGVRARMSTSQVEALQSKRDDHAESYQQR